MNPLPKLVAIVSLTLAACVQDDPTQQAPVKPREACTSEEQDRLFVAADVLKKRGFSDLNGRSILQRAAEEVRCPFVGPWLALFPEKDRWDAENYVVDQINYNILTGELYDYTDPVTLAGKIPECFKKGPPNVACRPNYHPLVGDAALIDKTATVCWDNPELKANPKLRDHPQADIFYPEQLCETPKSPRACKLDANWKAYCRQDIEIDSPCWGGAKADLVTAPPPQNVKPRIDLARAKRIQQAKVLAAPANTTPHALPGNVCAPLDWKTALK